MKLSFAKWIQVVLGTVILSGLFAMAAGYDIVPKDPANRALFDRILDAMWLVLSVPTLVSYVRKDENTKEEVKDVGKDQDPDK